MRQHWLGKGLKVVVFAAIAMGVFGFVVMSLWNWLMPALFGRSPITFWQAAGLLILSKILFSGWRGRAGPGGWYWRRRMMERWDQMTPEEREKFGRGLRHRCGPSEPATEPAK
jgi:hypothetical protein